jgi:hypothetical protein
MVFGLLLLMGVGSVFLLVIYMLIAVALWAVMVVLAMLSGLEWPS